MFRLQMDQIGNKWFLPTALLLLFCFSTPLSRAADTIFPGQSLSGNQTIVSEGGIFELGFFTPGNSQNYYLGIWYKNIPQSQRAVVWVANRDKPIPNASTSELKISQDGNLVLTLSQIQVWSSNLTSPTSGSIVAVLLDTGNFVLRDNSKSNSSAVLWQSFDHPTDTWLPTQKIGVNKLTGEKQLIISWRNLEDPSTGFFAEGLDLNATDQFFLWRNGIRYWASGLWDGKAFANIPAMEKENYLSYQYVSNERENYFSYTIRNTSNTSRVVMDVTGQTKLFKWMDESQSWLWLCLLPSDPCSIPSLCGGFSSCNGEAMSFCGCLQGFEPQFPKDWNLDDWSGGCVRRTPLQCDSSNSSIGEKDRFLTISMLQLPVKSQYVAVGSAEECESSCLNNCSCTAYSYNGSCSIWNGDLFDLRQLYTGSSNGGDSGVLYLRLAASELPSDNIIRKRLAIGIVIGVVAGSVVLLVVITALFLKFHTRNSSGASEGLEGPLVLFKYRDLLKATKNFSEKVGAGGFGTVFRGTLPDSTAIAVKKLERHGHGEKQFRAEVTTVGLIQHINLVTLRGFCSEGSERLLVYDYMPNGSLGSHLFRHKTKALDWTTRYQIAIGIARGLAYLHECCRDCIIHCDVKPENILLDDEFSPKVADFGLAKLFGRDFSKVLTTVRGTFGYLAPEWISGLAITPKADVYSYGMMLLEIISGRRNMIQTDEGNTSFFPIMAANKVKEDDVLSLLDYRLEGKADMDDLRRACRVAIWCIQDEERHRPTMGSVVQILEGVSEVDIPPTLKLFYNLGDDEDDLLPCEAFLSHQSSV